ncbi:MAG: nucleotidyl transferase AbiEii/AbiGii toxin family protein [Fibrobacter sp.]|jgi:predicted nucleotidyltransferase component of viral defense system|nr:nucleotidyl transferase AbiEii/AbiGii toxin family protein [Fibrobacter sp.]
MAKDFAKSIRNRLLLQTQETHGNYQQVLIRYFHERLIYRLAQSRYKTSFYLKGGSLLFALDPIIARPTLDVDFLGINFPSKPELLHSMFTEICSERCPEDGIVFDISSIHVENIMKDKQYLGLRIQILAHLDSIRQRISIDVGFGDSIVEAKEMEYPSLLNDLPKANIFAYSIESIIAEKFHAMITRDESNSRMKDFFDVYQVLTNHRIDKTILEKAIKATFLARKTTFNPNVKLFSQEFVHDELRLTLWKNFLHKIKYTKPLNFENVMDLIQNYMGQYWTKEFFESLFL